MPQIPTFQTSPGSVPGLSGGIPRANLDVRTVGMPDVSNALNQTIAAGNRLADFGQSFADKYIQAKMNVAAADDQALLSQKLNEAEFTASKIADRDQAGAAFDQASQKIWQDYEAASPHPLIQAHVRQSFDRERVLRMSQTQSTAFGLWGQEQRGKLITQTDAQSKLAIDASDPRLTEQIIQNINTSIDGRVAAGILPADKAAQMKIDIASNVYRSQTELAFAKSMQLGLAVYQQNRGKFNVQDGVAMGVMAEDRRKQVSADRWAIEQMPGGGGAVGAVHADAEAALGFKLPITSADRSEVHNREVGGAEGSQHLTPGSAQDISLAGLTEEQKAKVYNQFLSDPRVGGIGFYADHLHVDTRAGQRATWGTPPAAVAEQVKAWQASAPAPKQAEEDRIRTLELIQKTEADTTLDPDVKARRLAALHQRGGTAAALQSSQMAQFKDQEEQVAVAWSSGNYKAGGWLSLSETAGRLGDLGKQAAYADMAKHEAMYQKFATATPEEQRRMAPFLPGLAGKMAHVMMTEGRLDREVIRKDAQRTEDEARRLLNDPTADHRAGAAAAGEAIGGFLQAGTPADIAKAQALQQDFQGMVEGKVLGNLPTDQAQKALAEIQERFQNGGFSRKDAAAYPILQKMMAQTDHLKKTDPIRLGGDQFGPLTPMPTDPQKQQQWALDRTSRAAKVDGAYFPGADQSIAPFMTSQEIDNEKQILRTGTVQKQQDEAARMAVFVPRSQINVITKAIAGDGGDGFASAMAEAIALFGRNLPGDAAMARSLIEGANGLYQSGEASPLKVKLDATATATITSMLTAARYSAHWDGRDIKRQDHAIMARYASLLQGRDPSTLNGDALLRQAVTDIAGVPASSRNHGDWLLPTGVNEATFMDRIDGLTTADTGVLRPFRNGKAMTVDDIKKNGLFRTTGDGKYRVQMTDPTDGISYDVAKLDGSPLILNIRALRGSGQTYGPESGR